VCVCDLKLLILRVLLASLAAAPCSTEVIILNQWEIPGMYQKLAADSKVKWPFIRAGRQLKENCRATKWNRNSAPELKYAERSAFSAIS